MTRHAANSCWRENGQSLLETVLTLPVLILLVLNAINFGYFYTVSLNLMAAPRSGVEYSMEGFGTTAGSRLPDAGPSTAQASVSYLTYADMNATIPNAANASVQVCTKILGISGSGAGQTANCASYGSASFPAPDADPEAPWFVLNRVDVSYTFKPLIPGTPFGLALLPNRACTISGMNVTCTFHTQMSMRAMD